MTAVLRAEGLHRGITTTQGSVPLLAGTDLEVAAGEVVVVSGRSGSGKTTLLLTLAGLETPDLGTIEVGGRPLPARPPWDLVALLPQSLGLLEELTVEENVALPGRLATAGTERVPALLERLGLAHLAGRHPSETSLGEQQRTALARALAVPPAVLLADEPLSHQNRERGVDMLELIADQAALGTACILATHDALAFPYADRHVELRGGTLHPVG